MRRKVKKRCHQQGLKKEFFQNLKNCFFNLQFDMNKKNDIIENRAIKIKEKQVSELLGNVAISFFFMGVKFAGIGLTC